MIRIGIAVAFTLFLLTSIPAYAQVDRSEEVAELTAGLDSASSTRRVQTAKLITEAGLVAPALYEKVAALLKDGYDDGIEVGHVDEMSWLCKALAASGERKYQPLLEEIAAGAPSHKLQHYAQQSLELIDDYAKRLQVLNATQTWDPALSEEENRLLNMLESDDSGLRRDAAKTMVRSFSVDAKLFDAAEVKLRQMVDERRSGRLDIDAMAWLCKALAASGNGKYVATLQQVKTATGSPKLQMYADKALKQLE